MTAYLLAIQTRGQDRVHAAIGRRADRQRPRTRGFESGITELACQALQSQARPVALLGMRAVLHLPAHHAGGGRADALAPSAFACRAERSASPPTTQGVRGLNL